MFASPLVGFFADFPSSLTLADPPPDPLSAPPCLVAVMSCSSGVGGRQCQGEAQLGQLSECKRKGKEVGKRRWATAWGIPGGASGSDFSCRPHLSASLWQEEVREEGTGFLEVKL